MSDHSTRRGAGRIVCGLASGLMAALTTVTAAAAVAPTVTVQSQQAAAHSPQFDARIELERAALSRALPANPLREDAIARLREQVPDLLVRDDPVSGATRSLTNPTGYLASSVALDAQRAGSVERYLRANADLLGLTGADLEHYRISDKVYSKVTGATHYYLQQTHAGLGVYNGQIQVHINRDNQLIGVNNAFVPQIANSVNSVRPSLTAPASVRAAMASIGHKMARDPQQLVSQDRAPSARTADAAVRISPAGISRESIEARPMLLPVDRGETRLVWNFVIATLDGEHVYDFNVDARNGKVWTRFDRVAYDSYRVYPEPIESPIHTSPTPPSDGRQLIVDPAVSSASPFGWHDTNGSPGAEFTITRGNNTWAYEDSDGNNSPPANDVDCGPSLDCDFSLNLSQQPSNYRPAAVANLFYWVNLIHDIQYQYGFDEAGGNFQDNTYGNGGLGSDEVRAEAQDGSDINNARFFISTDGNSPRIEMYLWSGNPQLDGDFDNGIVVHEYGHGISTRQVGGPSNVSCLNNNQQPGEGWSDWLGLAYTAEPGDQGTDARGIGTYALGQPTSGGGIRTQRYSTSQSVNNWTYATIGTGVSIPHGVGAVWSQVLWEAYWAMVDDYGWDADLSTAGSAGNERMMLYVNEGLKNTACSPTFLDTRDAIIQAANDNFGGADVCPLWEVFAAYGLGTNATTGGSNSTSATNGFDVPASCQCQPQASADAGPDQGICLGESVLIGTSGLPTQSYQWAPGGESDAQIVVSPSSTTTYTLTATSACGVATDSATVTVDAGGTAGINDDFESGAGGWSSNGLWHLTSNSSCASPGYGSPVNAFYYGQDSSCTYDSGGGNSGDLTSPVISGITASSALSFNFFREVELYTQGSFDVAQVLVSSGSTETQVWQRDSTDTSAGSWNSSGSLSLSAWAGENIQVIFRFDTGDGSFNDFTGWFIDDVVVTGDSVCAFDDPPAVAITAPLSGSQVLTSDSVNFLATANDPEDGDLSAAVSWSSNIDGALGTGASITSSLSAGVHTVTASVNDSIAQTGTDSITVTAMQPANSPPTVSITAPADGSTFESGDLVTLSGTASDPEDGSLSASISWVSNLDGNLGAGASVSSTLSVGTHVITASVFDSQLLVDADTVSVTVNAPANMAPTVSITAPADGSIADAGTSVSFSGSAADAEDGDISASMSWTSSLDGSIGSGASFATAGLSLGTHTITATATDSGSLSDSASITVIIESGGGGTPVTVTLNSIGGEDGWTRESGENSNVGNKANATWTGKQALRVGDFNGDKQWKVVLSFDTSAIPAGATIQSATVRMLRGGNTGGDPFQGGFGDLLVDVNTGAFSGSTAVEPSDFEASSTAPAAGIMSAALNNGDWSEGALNSAGLAAINTTGRTQARVYFTLDDDDDGSNDYVGFYPGDNNTVANHPQLVITYIE